MVLGRYCRVQPAAQLLVDRTLLLGNGFAFNLALTGLAILSSWITLAVAALARRAQKAQPPRFHMLHRSVRFAVRLALFLTSARRGREGRLEHALKLLDFLELLFD
jgi:hypothetical protein